MQATLALREKYKKYAGIGKKGTRRTTSQCYKLQSLKATESYVTYYVSKTQLGHVKLVRYT